MEKSQNLALAHLYESVFSLNPNSFDEYNRFVGAAARDFLKPFGVLGAEYTISIPSNMPFSENVPGGGKLFGAEAKASSSLRLQFRFDRGGLIVFSLVLADGKILSHDERSVVNAAFSCFSHILQDLIVACTYKKLPMVDPATKTATLNAFMQFAGVLTATGKSRDYTAFYFNIKNFRSIHKSLSFVEGSALLLKYCRTVSDALARNEMIAHLGGDNFTALVLDEHRDYFMDLIQNMVIKFVKDDHILTFVFGATIGVVKLTDEANPGEIMMHVSSAYQAAREKRVSISCFDRITNGDIMNRKIILSGFYKAINENEFFVMYQPKVDVKTRTLAGAEALVRWKHGDGFIMPGSFIPVLENDGCICILDFYMLDKVCRFIRKIIDENMQPVKISVNFSKRHLSNNKFVEEIVDIIDKYGVPHGLIEVELTEGEDYHDHGVMKDIVEELNALGIRTSIDDFGTGYSSLSMLNSLQLDTLKIDKSFIPTSTKDKKSKGMIMLRSVVNLAKDLGLKTVAEGVETHEQFELMKKLGCDMIQGYIFDKPLTEADFVQRIKQRVYDEV